MENEFLNKWKSQVKKGTLSFIVLNAISKKELYGYELIEIVKNSTAIEIAEGTLYPLMNRLKKEGASEIRLLCLLAAPEGVARMKEAHPDVPIFTASLDEKLNEHGYIVPGLGDAGDRMFGTQS